jgi:hypothetical protein
MLAAGTADRIDLLRFPTGVLVVRPPPKGSDDTGGRPSHAPFRLSNHPPNQS